MKKKPIRPDNHIQEGASRHFFEGNLPRGWTSHKPENDYGVDLIVDIFEEKSSSTKDKLKKAKTEPQTPPFESYESKMNRTLLKN